MLTYYFFHGVCRNKIDLCCYEEKMQERMKLKWKMQTCVIDLEWHSFKFNTSFQLSPQFRPPFILQVCILWLRFTWWFVLIFHEFFQLKVRMLLINFVVCFWYYCWGYFVLFANKWVSCATSKWLRFFTYH